MTKLSDYLKIAEAARLVGVSQNTLRIWADKGMLPFRRNPANGYRLFRRQDLAEFLARVESSTNSVKTTIMKRKRRSAETRKN